MAHARTAVNGRVPSAFRSTVRSRYARTVLAGRHDRLPLATAVSGGAAAAPSGGAIFGAFAGDAALVLGLASRAVGHVSLLYGASRPADRGPCDRGSDRSIRATICACRL
ncbi:hypothetical protein F8280_00125 [Micromonospora noduli]|nr:hypothetical protein F8280_00125 [Micromonospora noduli]